MFIISGENQETFENLLLEIRNNNPEYHDLRFQKLTSQQIMQLVDALEENNSIISIGIRDSDIGKNMEAFAKILITNKSITYVDLQYNIIEVEELKIFTKIFEVNKIITHINLSQNDIKDTGVAVLTKIFEVNSNLKYLNIAGNNIGDEGAKALAKIFAVNKGIAHLIIGINKIGYDGIKAIAQSLEENNIITNIDFRSNDIGIKGHDAIRRSLEQNYFITNLMGTPEPPFRSIFKKYSDYFTALFFVAHKKAKDINYLLHRNRQFFMIALEKYIKNNLIATKEQQTLTAHYNSDYQLFTKKARKSFTEVIDKNFEVSVGLVPVFNNIPNDIARHIKGFLPIEDQFIFAFVMQKALKNYGQSPTHLIPQPLKLLLQNSENQAKELQYIQPILHEVCIGFKILDIMTDSIRLINEPDFIHAKKTVFDLSYLYSLYYGFNIYSLALSGGDSLYQCYQGKYEQAAKQIATIASYMILPTLINYGMLPYLGITIATPYIGTVYLTAITGYTGFFAITNIYSLYKEYNTPEWNLKSAIAYKDLAEFLSNSPLQHIYDFTAKSKKYEVAINANKLEAEKNQMKHKFEEVYGEFGNKLYELFSLVLEEKYELLQLNYVSLNVNNQYYKHCISVVSNNANDHYYCYNIEQKVISHIIIGENEVVHAESW